MWKKLISDFGSRFADLLTDNSQFAIRNPQSNGFTLIEAIMTLVVLSIAAVGVLSVFTIGIKGSANPLVVSQAIQLAQERMDTIIGDRENAARGYAWVVAADYSANALKYPAENPVAGFAGFSRTVVISCVTATDLNTSTGSPPCASGYAHVTVQVTNATLGTVSADTLVANY